MDALPFRKVHHFDGVVFQTGDEQALRLDIHGEMIKPAFHAVELHGAGWNQISRAGLNLCRGGLEEQQDGQNNQRVLTNDRLGFHFV